jgi:hypothetical protein
MLTTSLLFFLGTSIGLLWKPEGLHKVSAFFENKRLTRLFNNWYVGQAAVNDNSNLQHTPNVNNIPHIEVIFPTWKEKLSQLYELCSQKDRFRTESDKLISKTHFLSSYGSAESKEAKANFYDNQLYARSKELQMLQTEFKDSVESVSQDRQVIEDNGPFIATITWGDLATNDVFADSSVSKWYVYKQTLLDYLDSLSGFEIAFMQQLLFEHSMANPIPLPVNNNWAAESVRIVSVGNFDNGCVFQAVPDLGIYFPWQTIFLAERLYRCKESFFYLLKWCRIHQILNTSSVNLDILTSILREDYTKVSLFYKYVSTEDTNVLARYLYKYMLNNEEDHTVCDTLDTLRMAQFLRTHTREVLLKVSTQENISPVEKWKHFEAYLNNLKTEDYNYVIDDYEILSFMAQTADPALLMLGM